MSTSLARVNPDGTLVALKPQRPPDHGRMRVVLNVHGGQQGLADVLEGLVQRNVRAFEAGRAPLWTPGLIKVDDSARAWKDAPKTAQDGKGSAGTVAAYRAASLRADGLPARLGFRSGYPAVYRPGMEPEVFRTPKPIKLGEREGRTDERMVVTIDDNEASAVRDINQAIARHNARRIKERGLPPLYKSGVFYKTEGSPELWWDAEEILRNGHDDCEGLAAYRAGELMNRGYDARVWTRLIAKPSKEMGGGGGGRLFHAITRVRLPDGRIKYDDPSMRLGMPVPEWYQQWSAKMRAEGKEL